MTNEEYYKVLSSKADILKQLRTDCKDIAAEIIGRSLFKEDLFFCASVDRCMHLIDGFITMIQERNLTCAGALLRLQLDNCMRTFAAFIADNKEAVVDCIISGGRIDQQKSKDGNQLKDGYLKKELNKIDPQFSAVYGSTSGYIHLSSKAFYQTVDALPEFQIELRVGLPLLEKYNEILIQGMDAFIHFVKLHLKILSAVVDSKICYDKFADENDL